MCVMSSAITQHTGEARHDLFKRLLCGSSPKNPTYILGRVIADFTAQSSTELTVRGGEEIFVLFEINEWAFATVFSDSTRRGYVPLDYCDIIKDFYEHASSPRSAPASNRCSRSTRKVCRDDSHFQKLQNYSIDAKEGISKEIIYYATKHKDLQSHTSHSTQPHSADKSNLSHTSHSRFANAEFGELYKEQTILDEASQSCHPAASAGRRECCCCCDKRKCHRNREDRYKQVLDYLNDAQIPLSDSHCEDSESGLGDSESIISFCDLPLHSSSVLKEDVNLNDMSTQTSRSLEDIQTQLMKLSVDPGLVELPDRGSCDSYPCSDNYMNVSQQHSAPSSRCLPADSSCCRSGLSPPSADSSLNDSVFVHSVSAASPTKYSSGEESSFEREDFLTVRRKHVTDDAECSRVTPLLAESTSISDNDQSNDSGVVTAEQPVEESPASYLRKISLPVLEKGKRPNKVELTRLSMRIKEKLKPARDELLSKRLDMNKSPQPTTQETHHSETEELETTKSNSTSEDSLSNAHNKERQQRESMLQSIQEQYMKLEEARLLHNALKQLNDVMAVPGNASS